MGNNVFSPACPSFCPQGEGSLVAITYDALDLTVQDASSTLAWLDMRHQTVPSPNSQTSDMGLPGPVPPSC